MRRPRWPLGAVLLASWLSLAIAQQYNQRHSLPVETLPFDDVYDDYYTDGYDFKDEVGIYRWNVEDYPHPTKLFRFCNRLKPSHVCDPDFVLEKEQADRLDSFIQQLYHDTPCICDECDTTDEGGIVLGIALLKNVFQPYNEHPSRTIRKFAQTLRSNWTLGKCDNDILIVVVTSDRLAYTDVGPATAAYVSLHDAHRIFLENKGYLSGGNFYEGLRSMVGDYYNQTKGIRLLDKKELNLGLISGSIVGAVVVLGVMLCIIFVLYKKCQKSKKDKDDADKDVENVGLRSGSQREGLSSSWTKKDIKVLFGASKTNNKYEKTPSSAKYEPCETDERDNFRIDEEEIIDTTLALPSNPNESATLPLHNKINNPVSGQAASPEDCMSADGLPEATAQTTTSRSDSGSSNQSPGQSSSDSGNKNPQTSGGSSSSSSNRSPQVPGNIPSSGSSNVDARVPGQSSAGSSSMSPGSNRTKSDSDENRQQRNGDIRNIAETDQANSSSSPAEVLEDELATAVEGITYTFHTFQPRSNYQGQQTAL